MYWWEHIRPKQPVSSCRSLLKRCFSLQFVYREIYAILLYDHWLILSTLCENALSLHHFLIVRNFFCEGEDSYRKKILWVHQIWNMTFQSLRYNWHLSPLLCTIFVGTVSLLNKVLKVTLFLLETALL